MDRILLGASLALGSVGWVCGWALSSAKDGKGGANGIALARSFWLVALAAPALVFVVSLAQKPPFAAGQGFGAGVLLGGIGALLAAFVLLRAAQVGNLGQRLAPSVVAPFGMAVAVVAVPLLWIRASLFDTLLGVALGWLVASFPLLLALPRRERASESLSLPLAAGIGFVVSLAGMTALGEARNALTLTNGARVSWGAASLAMAAGMVCILLLSATGLWNRIALRLPFAGALSRLGGQLTQGAEAERNATLVANGVVSGLLLFGLAWMLNRRLGGATHLPLLIGAGIVFGLAAWRTLAARDREPDAHLPGWQGSALAALCVVAGFLVAQQQVPGVGFGILLLPLWLMVGLAVASALDSETPLASRTAQNVTRIACLGAALLLYRLVSVRYSVALRGMPLTDTYALIGLLIGCATPALLANYLLRPLLREARDAQSADLLRLVIIGVGVLLFPAVLLILFGGKCALALAIGAALAIVTTDRLEDDSDARALLLPTLLALAGALALAQWTEHLLTYALLGRDQKIRFLSWAIGGGVLALLIADYEARFRNRSGGANRPDAAQGAAQ